MIGRHFAYPVKRDPSFFAKTPLQERTSELLLLPRVRSDCHTCSQLFWGCGPTGLRPYRPPPSSTTQPKIFSPVSGLSPFQPWIGVEKNPVTASIIAISMNAALKSSSIDTAVCFKRGFYKMDGRQTTNRSRVQVSVHQVWVVHNCVSLYTIARGTSAATSPEPVLPPLQHQWI